VPVNKALPKNLTVADWNSKKAIPTKISGNTGIGAGLTKLRAEWDKVDWEDLDPDVAIGKQSPTHEITLAALNLALPAAKANLNKLPAVRKQLTALVTLMGQTETKWRSKKLITSASVKHVTGMKTTVTQLIKALDEIDDEWVAARQRANLQAEQKLKSTLTHLRGRIANARTKAAELQQDLTSKKYGAAGGLHQKVNELNEVLQGTSQPQWAQARTRLAALSATGYLPTKDEQVADKVKTVLRVLDELEQAL
jgi:hypothetical protein